MDVNNSLQMPDDLDLEAIFGSLDQQSIQSTLQQPQQGVGLDGSALGLVPTTPAQINLNINMSVDQNQGQVVGFPGMAGLDALMPPTIAPANPFMQVNSNSTDELFGSGDDMDIISQEPNSGRIRRSKSKNRTPQQQKQNKLAQQRYRERKKQKYGEMEQAVTILTEKANKLEQVEQQNAQLQGQNEMLSREISELQYEVSRLRAQIAQQQQFNGQRLNTQQQDDDHSQQQIQKTFSELKQIIQKYDLSAKDDKNLYHMNCEESKIFGKLVSSCILASINGQSTFEQNNGVNKRDYINLIKKSIQEINLSSKQADQIISYRNSFLSKFNQFQEQREKLNLKIMSFLVQQSNELCEIKTPDNNGQKIDGLQNGMQRDVQLQVALEQLQMVMLETKRCYDEFVGHVLKEVLGIVQRAVLVTTIYPHMFDMLVFADVVQQDRNLLKSSNSSNSSSSGIYVEVLTV